MPDVIMNSRLYIQANKSGKKSDKEVTYSSINILMQGINLHTKVKNNQSFNVFSFCATLSRSKISGIPDVISLDVGSLYLFLMKFWLMKALKREEKVCSSCTLLLCPTQPGPRPDSCILFELTLGQKALCPPSSIQDWIMVMSAW